MAQNSDDQFKHFPLNMPDDSTKNESNDFGANQVSDDLILFPLEQNINLVQQNSTAISQQPGQTNHKKRKNSTSSTKPPNRSTTKSAPFIKSKPAKQPNPPVTWKQPPKKSRSFFKILVFAILFYFFKDRLMQNSYINKLTNWVVEHSPFGKKIQDFEDFKKGKLVYYAEDPNINPIHRFKKTSSKIGIYSGELILIEKTGELRKRYILPKGVKEKMVKSYTTVSTRSGLKKVRTKDKVTNTKTFIREMGDTNIDMMLFKGNLEKNVLLQEWDGGPIFNVRLESIEYYEETALTFIWNDFESFKKNDTGIVYIPTYIYNKLVKNKNVKGLSLKNIPTKSIRELVY